MIPAESKAGKRRRDLVTRVEKIRELNYAKRDECVLLHRLGTAAS